MGVVCWDEVVLVVVWWGGVVGRVCGGGVGLLCVCGGWGVWVGVLYVCCVCGVGVWQGCVWV